MQFSIATDIQFFKLLIAPSPPRNPIGLNANKREKTVLARFGAFSSNIRQTPFHK
jgi:hypothetical protein